MELNSLLKETIQNAAEEASHVLQKWLKAPIRITMEGVAFIPIKEVVERSGKPDDVSVAIVHRVEKGLEGILFLLITEESAGDLISLLMKQAHEEGEFTEMEQSALMETSNILSSSYMNCLRKSLGLEMIPGPPIFLHDLTQAIISSLMLEQASYQDESLFIDILFHMEGGPMGLRFFYLPVVESLKKLLSHSASVTGEASL